MRTIDTLATVIVALAAGCATAHPDTERESRPIAARSTPAAISSDDLIAFPPGRRSDVVLGDEILSVTGLAGLTAYDAVARLRPGFLSRRDARTGARYMPAVFIGGVFSGGTDVLRLVPASAVAEMRYLRSSDAVMRYGPSYEAGIILVRLRR